MIQALKPDDFLSALLAAPRPGVEKILAFYDNRARGICTDGHLLLIPLDDHLCHRGDGLFESICYRDGKIYRNRDRDILQAICQIRPARAKEKRGYRPCRCQKHGPRRKQAPWPRSWPGAFTSAYPPKQEYLARIKSVNYLPNVLMAAEAVSRAEDVAITFDEAGNMGEAAIANVAIIDENGCFRSPEPGRVLPGTTLLCALEIADQKMPVKTGPIHIREMLKAKEMLLLTSATLCVPIVRFDGRPVADGQPGAVARWLKDELLAYMLKTGTSF